MKATELVEKIQDLVIEHGDFDIFERETGATVKDVIFSDEENEPDFDHEPWFEMILEQDE